MEDITILIPTYNRGHLIDKTLDSCLLQTYRNFKVLIYDDGSTDGTETIVKAYSNNHKNIKYIKGSGNNGIGYARQFLLDSLDTEYGVWLDSDDLMDSKRLEKCLQYMVENPTVEILYTDIQRFHEPLVFMNTIKIDISKYTKQEFRSLNNNTSCATAFFRNSIKRYKFETGLKHSAEDALWLWRLLCNNVVIGHIPELLYLYRSHNDRAGVKKNYLSSEEKAIQQGILSTKIKEYKANG